MLRFFLVVVDYLRVGELAITMGCAYWLSFLPSQAQVLYIVKQAKNNNNINNKGNLYRIPIAIALYNLISNISLASYVNCS
jgi:hypothetical protein